MSKFLKDEIVPAVTSYFMYSEIQGSALIEKSAFITGEKPEVPESILVVAAVVNQDANQLQVMFGEGFYMKFLANTKIQTDLPKPGYPEIGPSPLTETMVSMVLTEKCFLQHMAYNFVKVGKSQEQFKIGPIFQNKGQKYFFEDGKGINMIT